MPMVDPTSPRGQSASAETRQHEQPQQQQNTPVHSPTSSSSSFHQHPPQQYYSPQYHNPQDPRHPQQPQPHQFAPSNMQQPYYRPQGLGGPPHHHHGAYDMHGMAQNLPQPNYQHQQQQPYGGVAANRGGPRGYTMGPGAAPSATGHPGAQYTGHVGGPGPMQQTYYMPQQPPMMAQQYYGGGHVPTMAPRHGSGGGAGGYGYYANQAPGYYYTQPGQYATQHHQPMHHQGTTSGSGTPGNYPSPAIHASRRPSQPLVVTGKPQSDGIDGSPRLDQRSHPGQGHTQTTSVVRGPPRKPKQSGHAIWIGNLPPQTNLMSLVHHVCQQTDGLESLFLISKSNCAFANYPDEERCLAAQQKLNDTWYMSVRLVSRLRKNAVEGAQGITAPTGPGMSSTTTTTTTTGPLTNVDGNASPDAATENNNDEPTTNGDDPETHATSTPRKPSSQTSVIVDGSGKSGVRETTDQEAERTATTTVTPAAAKAERYFILKSLTVEDLELSVRTGIWATQSHNEDTLNDAFKTCDNVYLVFSANKSGEYFGYARMTSEINQDPAAAIAFAPTSQSVAGIDLPKAIPTEATETTPRGRIIDDSARGTIFWEAQGDDDNEESDETKQEEDNTGADGADGVDGTDGADGLDSTDGVDGADGVDGVDGTDRADGADGVDGTDEPKAWGKPFQLEWLSTTRLPFYRTRGMRNPLNSNREIKIARDGTEVDPAIGRKLATFFHQPAWGSPANTSGSGGNAARG